MALAHEGRGQVGLRVLQLLGIAESLHQEAKSKKCKAILIIGISSAFKIILWPLVSQSLAWFELFALHGAKIPQTPVQWNLDPRKKGHFQTLRAIHAIHRALKS